MATHRLHVSLLYTDMLSKPHYEMIWHQLLASTRAWRQETGTDFVVFRFKQNDDCPKTILGIEPGCSGHRFCNRSAAALVTLFAPLLSSGIVDAENFRVPNFHQSNHLFLISQSASLGIPLRPGLQQSNSRVSCKHASSHRHAGSLFSRYPGEMAVARISWH